MDTNLIYTEIGKMAYAVAKANGEVKEQEIENIFNFIDEEIKTSGTNAVMFVGEEFTKLRRMNASPRDAFSMFTSFIENHGKNIQQSIKNMCVRLAIHIARTDEGIDETEVALINKLKQKLETA